MGKQGFANYALYSFAAGYIVNPQTTLEWLGVLLTLVLVTMVMHRLHNYTIKLVVLIFVFCCLGALGKAFAAPYVLQLLPEELTFQFELLAFLALFFCINWKDQKPSLNSKGAES